MIYGTFTLLALTGKCSFSALFNPLFYFAVIHSGRIKMFAHN